MRKVRRVPLVDIELRQAADYYESASTGLGKRFLADVECAIGSLATDLVDHAIRFQDIRRVNLKKFPYALYYLLDADDVIVIAVLHTHADTREKLLRRRRLL